MEVEASGLTQSEHQQPCRLRSALFPLHLSETSLIICAVSPPFTFAFTEHFSPLKLHIHDERANDSILSTSI